MGVLGIRYEQDGRNRCLKLLMTDGECQQKADVLQKAVLWSLSAESFMLAAHAGHQQICGIELSRLGMLACDMPVGFKVIAS